MDVWILLQMLKWSLNFLLFLGWLVDCYDLLPTFMRLECKWTDLVFEWCLLYILHHLLLGILMCLWAECFRWFLGYFFKFVNEFSSTIHSNRSSTHSICIEYSLRLFILSYKSSLWYCFDLGFWNYMVIFILTRYRILLISRFGLFHYFFIRLFFSKVVM